MLVGATAYRMLHGFAPNDVKPNDVVLVWGGAGGLGSMAIQICAAVGAIPVAVVSSDDKVDYCIELGARGCINRNDFKHWGMLPHWTDKPSYDLWMDGVRAFGAAIWKVVGERRRASGRDDATDVAVHLRLRRSRRHLRRHHRLQRHARSALPVDAAEAPAGLAFRQ